MNEQVVESVDFDGGVVVGVEDSESSVQALRCAAEEARCHHTVLRVLRAWSVRTAPRPPGCPPGAVPTLLEFEQEVLRRTTEFVRRHVGDDTPYPVEVHVVHASAAQALIQASRCADLLVIGHHGRGGIADRLLGSVAEQCVRECRCPVMVVRPHDDRPAGERSPGARSASERSGAERSAGGRSAGEPSTGRPAGEERTGRETAPAE